MNSNGSKVLCRVNAQTIRDGFLVSESDINYPEQFNEEECFKFYNQVSQNDKFMFLAKFSKLDQSIVDTPLPYNVKDFQEPVQCFFSLLIQILVHDDDTMVYEVMIGCLLKSSKLISYKYLKVDEFLAEKIHSQLENFHMEKSFKYLTLLLLMVIHSNLAELQERDQVTFLDKFNISMETGSFSFLEFANKVMARLYFLFFDSELPRVSKDMKVKLQLSTEPTRDLFLYKYFTVLRIYSSTDAPYRLPAFLTSRIFAL